MKMKILPILFGLLFFVGVSQERKIKGKVSDGTNPMENVEVSIKDGDKTVVTDANGAYAINAQTGDRIVYQYAGMKTITIRVEDVTRILNPIMVPDIKELDEVEVTASKRRSQKDLAEDYLVNDNIIRTAFGYLDADRAPGNVRIMTDEEINPVNVCIADLLLNEFAGVEVRGNCQQGGSVIIRGFRSLLGRNAAVFDVDGLILQDMPIWINIDNIKRIAILNNLATTARYGALGSAGVIVINTIGGNPKSSQAVDRARLRNNYVTGKVLTQTEVKNNAAGYVKEMMASNSLEDSKKVFENYSNTYNNSPYFFLDAYTHFVDKWGDETYADAIINENYGLFQDNAVLLKALAYTYESQGRTEMANEIYKEVFILRPNYSQSYLDMANSYRDISEPKQAAGIFSRYNYLLEQGFLEADTLGFTPLMAKEFGNLLALKRNVLLEGNKARKLYKKDNEFKGTRLVFEWNDSEAEFELQFVNPENQYYKFKHSLADNEAVINREKEYGFNVMEELIDGSLPGLWKLNVKYLGNKSLTPTYLKATVYYNYGQSSQRKETKTFKLDLKNVNQELFKVNIAGVLTQE